MVGAHPPVLLVFPLCLVFPPVDRHSRLDLSHYYTRFSYYTRHPFYFEANVEKKFACRYTRLPFYSPVTHLPLSPSITHPSHPRSSRSSLSSSLCTIIITILRNEVVEASSLSLISLNLNFPDSLDSGGGYKVLP